MIGAKILLFIEKTIFFPRKMVTLQKTFFFCEITDHKTAKRRIVTHQKNRVCLIPKANENSS